MQINCLFVFAAVTVAARALPTNISTFSSVVHTAGYYDPNNLASDGL
jgi:hypothetical protein